MELDLTRMDEYPNGVVPDEDLMTCLKVLRTVRGVCLRADDFKAYLILTLSEAHRTLVKVTQACKKESANANGK